MSTAKKVRKILFRIILSCMIALIMSPYFLMLVNPLRRPQSMLTNYVLRLAPVGTDMYDVLAIIENHRGWNTRGINYSSGFRHPRPSTVVPDWRDAPLLPSGWTLTEWNNVMVGDKSIRVRGRHWPASYPVVGLLMNTVVTIYWGFDADGKLIEVFVTQSSAQ